MQQFQVPQYIDLEPKILGPLTLVQSVVVVGAGAFIFILRFLLEIYLFRISFNISWLILAKNFLISHFSTQQVRILFLLT